MSINLRDVILRRVTVSPSAGAYADHDQVGTLITLTDVFRAASKKAEVISVSVVDSTTQAAALTLHFFRESPTVASADNEALNVSDAQLAANWCGKVEIPAANYQSVTTATVASVSDVGLMVDGDGLDLYCLLESAGTPTYGASASLTLIIGLLRG